MKVLGTTETTYEIEKLLNDAAEYLIFVTPYIKINKRLKVKLSDAFKTVKKVYFVYRKNEITKEEVEWFKLFNNVELLGINNLHAKIYINEKKAIISSMNLYEYSQVNNHEISLLIDTKPNIESFRAILEEIRIIVESEYNNHSIIDIVENVRDYTMGKLYYKYAEYPQLKREKTNGMSVYEYISKKAMQIVDFSESELYEDKTAILKATNLGKERYSKLKSMFNVLINED